MGEFETLAKLGGPHKRASFGRSMDHWTCDVSMDESIEVIEDTWAYDIEESELSEPSDYDLLGGAF